MIDSKFIVNENFKDKLKKLDTIYCHPESQNKIKLWAKNAGHLVYADNKIRVITKVTPPLNEAIIKHEKSEWLHYYKVTNDTMKLITMNKDAIKIISNIGLTNNEIIDFEHNLGNISNDNLEKLIEYEYEAVLIQLMIFLYMNEYKENIERVEKKQFTSVQTTNKKKKNEKKSILIGKYYIRDFEISADSNKRVFERHIDSWGVRGHWRTYKKSGNRVWIPEYKKGKGEKEAKEYKV